MSHGLGPMGSWGGLRSELLGGNFSAGCLAAGFLELVSPIYEGLNTVQGTAVSAVVGGVGAVLGGGKFVNGAITSAFGYLYNQALSVRNAYLSVGEEGVATQDEAGKAAIEAVNPASKRNNVEYSGLIYETSDGDFGFTDAVSGSRTSSDPYALVGTLPEDSVIVGTYHTHGDYSRYTANGSIVRTTAEKDEFNSDKFSADDVAWYTEDRKGRDERFSMYLGTPGGDFCKFGPQGREIGDC